MCQRVSRFSYAGRGTLLPLALVLTVNHCLRVANSHSTFVDVSLELNSSPPCRYKLPKASASTGICSRLLLSGVMSVQCGLMLCHSLHKPAPLLVSHPSCDKPARLIAISGTWVFDFPHIDPSSGSRPPWP